MFLKLPEPRDELLSLSPLKLVICQVRYSRKLAVTETKTGLDIQAILSDGTEDAWQLDQFVQHTLALEADESGVTSATGMQPQSGWKLTSADGVWEATVLPGAVGIETPRYPGWPTFSAQLDRLLVAVEKVIAPEGEERVGLRYINQIEHPRATTPKGWERWIRPEALGMLLHPDIGPGAISCQQQFDIDVGRGIKASIRHGMLPERPSGLLSYLIDLDTYRAGVRAFSARSVIEATPRLNRLARQLFQGMITDELYAHLRGGNDANDGGT